jgi:hypothetical protein
MTGPLEQVDFIVGGGVYLSPQLAAEGGFAEGYVRFFPTEAVALAAKVGWESDTGAFVGPALHSVWWITESVSWWTNLEVPIAPSSEGVSVGVVGSFAPEVWLGPVGVFLEFDPEVWFEPDGSRYSAAMLAPGLSFWFGPEEMTGITVAALIPVVNPDELAPAIGINFYGERPLAGEG